MQSSSMTRPRGILQPASFRFQRRPHETRQTPHSETVSECGVCLVSWGRLIRESVNAEQVVTLERAAALTCRRRLWGACVEWATVGDAGVMGELGWVPSGRCRRTPRVAHHSRVTEDEG